MNSSVRKLIDIASQPFTGCLVTGMATTLPELRLLLSQKNGFFAFESALRVFPAGDSAWSYSFDEWNSEKLWRSHYGNLADGLLFFAEDVFGAQFCMKEGAVHTFDPETGDLTFVASSIEDWASLVLSDYDYLTGHSLAHEWQQSHGPLAPRDRLMPKIPFVCGGEFKIDNLDSIEGSRAMRSRGNLAIQIRDLPDGARIQFEIVD
jgi:hypothetical protein